MRAAGGGNRGAGLNAADKRHAILLALKAWPDKSSSQIAQQVGCSDQYVLDLRKQVPSSWNLPSRVTGKDGKSYPAARAIRRCGELLKAFHSEGGRPAKTQDGTVPSFPTSQTEAGRQAGMGERQIKTAVRVSNVPALDNSAGTGAW